MPDYNRRLAVVSWVLVVPVVLIPVYLQWITNLTELATLLVSGIAIVMIAGGAGLWNRGGKSSGESTRLPSVHLVQPSYWPFKFRRVPVPKENLLNFWISMPVMFAMGVYILYLTFFGFAAGAKNIVTEVSFLVMGVFLIGFTSWLMGNEIFVTRQERSNRIRSFAQRKSESLSSLEQAYNALDFINSIQARKVILETVRSQIRSLAFGDLDIEGRKREPLDWDEDIRDNLVKLFKLASKDLSNSEIAAAYSELLTYILRRGDIQTINSMKTTLTTTFDLAYPKFIFDFGQSQWIFDALIGLHDYDPQMVNQYMDDSLIGNKPKFDALVRSLQLDLLMNLRAKSNISLIKINLAKQINELEGKNQEALERAKILAAMF